MALRVAAGTGAKLRQALDRFIRILARTMPTLASDATAVEDLLEKEFLEIRQVLQAENGESQKFNAYLTALRQDIFDNIDLFLQIHSIVHAQAQVQNAPQNLGTELILNAENEGMLESYLSRFRANLLVDHRQQTAAPVIYDDDPTYQSLFGSFESGTEQASSLPEFMRLRAGNLLRADGGMLMLHLRDVHSDQHNGPQILEKLHRFLRNGRVQIEESVSHGGQAATTHPVSEPLPVQVRLVLIATREEFYRLQDEAEEFARFFNVKVDFTDDFPADTRMYREISGYIAERCEHFALPHFSAEAVARVLETMHRWVEEKAYISSRLAELQHLILAAAAEARSRAQAKRIKDVLVEKQDVLAVLQASYKRHRHPEMQLLRAIVDGDLMISVQGRELGQINGLTHIDLGDAGFGSPVRISARCFAGEDGVINIDREVEMTGPNHDKGLFILQSWLSASFAKLTPLSLDASLVFEQEYHGVEGDSASCAELYALLSAISGLPLPQGIAVTGAMNQHGEVMAIGGVNEKIEGYFRVCQAMGLDGSQGVLIPQRNAAHLVLNEEVVAAGKCHGSGAACAGRLSQDLRQQQIGRLKPMANQDINETEKEKCRLDKWLWAARFFKTRSIAADAVDSGKVRVDSDRVKPAKEVKIGASVHIRTKDFEIEVLVRALSNQRRGAPEAQLLYEETESSRARRAEVAVTRENDHAQRERGAGRPTKRQRREIKGFTDNW
jgi:predicted ATP-dependent protease/ribosomal 50S subunit-recycling heat shock protein